MNAIIPVDINNIAVASSFTSNMTWRNGAIINKAITGDKVQFTRLCYCYFFSS